MLPHILLQLWQALPELGRERGWSSWDLALARRDLVCAGLDPVATHTDPGKRNRVK